jgi:hypothetical protein
VNHIRGAQMTAEAQASYRPAILGPPESLDRPTDESSCSLEVSESSTLAGQRGWGDTAPEDDKAWTNNSNK